MQFWKKCKRFINGIFMTFMTLITLGASCGILLTSILVLMRYPLTRIDTSILTWLIVAFCISVVCLFYALIAQCFIWKYSKLFLGIIFTIFDLFLLFLGILIFVLRKEMISNIGKLWMPSSSQSASVQYLESYFKCCGFDENTNMHCYPNSQIVPLINRSENDQESLLPFCRDAMYDSLKGDGNFLGSIIFILFGLLLIVIIFTFLSAYRQLKRPEDPELTEFQGQHNPSYKTVFF